ncbi:tyrosine protein kinase [Burkholderia ubonensis]|uniref:polysaccharide biosynthesis tyrosine autokinase n=1 Tax=Burkholderia ubonensis TaxID=101571 RepID=UPI0008417458|nr:polysaccharide biosynthesis tyrosine autokinase [Burkholderia ubonensis]AOK62101.1 tyrosine protein kinase [Burkholderia ubonensis]
MTQSNQHADVNVVETTELDLASVLDILLDNRLLIAAIATVFTFISGLYALLVTPIYESNILVQIEDSPDASAAKDLLGTLSTMFDVKSTADAEIQILGSRLVVSRAVDKLKLFIHAKPHRFPVIGGWLARRRDGLSVPGLFGVGGYTWGRESIDVATFDVPKQLEGKPYKLVALAGGRYELSGPGFDQPVKGRVGTAETFPASAGPIKLLVRGINGTAGAGFDLVRGSRMDTIEDLQKQLRIQELGKQSGVISATLRSDDPVQLSAILNEIGDQYVRQNVDRKAAQAENSLQFLASQEPKMKRDLEQAENRLNDYRNKHKILDLTEEGKSILAQSLDAEQQHFTLTQKRQELLTRFGPMHPGVVAIDEQIAGTLGYIGELTDQIKRMPTAQRDAIRLQRDVQVNTDLYLALRNNIEQLRLLKAGKVGSVRLVDAASLPERAVFPKKTIVVVVATLLGLFVGAGAAFVRDQLFTGITNVRSLEAHSGLAVYATVPHSEQQRKLAANLADSMAAGQASLLANSYPGDPAVESLRSLRTALQFAMLDANNNVVLLTGPSPGLGKSFASANLAVVLAENKRVVLVDGDLRRGILNKYFGEERGAGVADLIAGTRSAADVIRKTNVPNLDLVTTGTLPPNAATLLLNRNWLSFIQKVSAEYDIVLIDSPPVLAVADAAIMATIAGTVFLVARFGKTRVGEVMESVKQLAQSGSRVSGLIFNGMKTRGGNYRYGGKYGSYRYVSYDYENT